jgi:hypothetical protein
MRAEGRPGSFVVAVRVSVLMLEYDQHPILTRPVCSLIGRGAPGHQRAPLGAAAASDAPPTPSVDKMLLKMLIDELQ